MPLPRGKSQEFLKSAESLCVWGAAIAQTKQQPCSKETRAGISIAKSGGSPPSMMMVVALFNFFANAVEVDVAIGGVSQFASDHAVRRDHGDVRTF